MMYPDLQIDSSAYRVTADDGSVEDRSDDGTLLVRSLWPEVRYRLTVRHPHLSLTQWQNFRQWARSYRHEPVTFMCPLTGDSYTVLVRRQPGIVSVDGPWITCEIELEGTLDD